MQYVLLLYYDKSTWFDASPETRADVIERHNSLPARAAELGVS